MYAAIGGLLEACVIVMLLAFYVEHRAKKRRHQERLARIHYRYGPRKFIA